MAIDRLSVGASGAATSVVAISAETTEPFTVTITWHAPSGGGSFGPLGHNRGDPWTVTLSGSQSYTVTSQHQFDDMQCRYGVRAVSDPPAEQNQGYPVTNAC
ncbi:hypothetical protein [Streptomyces massasporeus]|uniref:hypothetical protein n=1 Tax=Streptomyces massasporeus TaxID=67324 RepID=UPI003821C416